MKSTITALALLLSGSVFASAQSPAPLITPPATAPAATAAEQIVASANLQFAQLYGVWDHNVRVIWQNPATTPAQVFAALGANAKAVVIASGVTVTLLETLRPGCTAATAALIQPTTVHDDGTVTVNP